jgi:hypothetical protein
VTEQVKDLVTRWQHVVAAVPVHLMKIDAKVDETALSNIFRDMHQELNAEQQAFNRHEDVNTILERNKVSASYKKRVFHSCFYFIAMKQLLH